MAALAFAYGLIVGLRPSPMLWLAASWLLALVDILLWALTSATDPSGWILQILTFNSGLALSALGVARGILNRRLR